jgi:hypothetical protein
VAEGKQNHIQEVQEQQLLIKKKDIKLQFEIKRKEDETRAEQELLALEKERLQARSESWMRNQQTIQEALIIEAGAEAEANAIIQETSSRSASPNLGLESFTINEKMNRFLGTAEPEEFSQEDYFNPMVFHRSAFESVRPKQALTFKHPVVTTTTTPANNFYVSPPQLSFRVSSDLALPPPLLSHIPISTVPDAYAPPPLPSPSVHSIPIITKPVAGHAPPTTPPLTFIPQVSLGMHPTYSLPIRGATGYQATQGCGQYPCRRLQQQVLSHHIMVPLIRCRFIQV